MHYNIAKFEVSCWNISLSPNFLFLKSDYYIHICIGFKHVRSSHDDWRKLQVCRIYSNQTLTPWMALKSLREFDKIGGSRHFDHLMSFFVQQQHPFRSNLRSSRQIIIAQDLIKYYVHRGLGCVPCGTRNLNQLYENLTGTAHSLTLLCSGKLYFLIHIHFQILL